MTVNQKYTFDRNMETVHIPQFILGTGKYFTKSVRLSCLPKIYEQTFFTRFSCEESGLVDMFEMQLFGKNASRLGQMPAVILRVLLTHGLKTDILLVHLSGTAKAGN